MKIKPLIFLLVFVRISAIAQPGGGGGLKILSVLDYDSKPIAKGDTSLKIQHYILSNKKYKVTKEYTLSESEKRSYDYYVNSNPFIYLPPYLVRKDKYKKINIPNQRLVLIYNKDTMTIDFIDIMEENGGGDIDFMEHIQFESGYYKCFRSPQKSHKEMWDTKLKEENRKEIILLLQFGIDGNTTYQLKKIGLMEHIPDPNLERKRLERERVNCKELWVGEKYSNLCYNMIDVNDKDSTIKISSNQVPLLKDSSTCFHFFYYYQFHGGMMDMNKPETQIARVALQKLTSYKIAVNNTLYTGQIKIAVYYYNAGISTTYSKYIIYVGNYKDGKLLNTSILNDVDLDTEQGIIRSG